MSGKRKGRRILKALGILVLAGILCFAGVMGFVIIGEERARRESENLRTDYDAIIVLGAQVLASGEPNTQLQWRLDAAKEAWDRRPVPLVVCGAQGADEPMPESEAMKRYLVRAGVPEEQIHEDPDSFNTNQNLQNAAEILRGIPGVERVLIVTSDYHVPRAMKLAEDLGFRAAGLGSPCKTEYWLKNHAREALAWIKYFLNHDLHIPIEWNGKFPS